MTKTPHISVQHLDVHIGAQHILKDININIPDKKSTLVKQILEGLGVTIQQIDKPAPSNYKQRLANVSVWTDDDLKIFEESKKAFENLKSEEW